MSKKLTVGDLKKALENVPEDLEVKLSSDSGVDQCDDDDFDVVVEDAYRHNYTLSIGKTFEDGTNEVDEFLIYANFRKLKEIEDDL